MIEIFQNLKPSRKRGTWGFLHFLAFVSLWGVFSISFSTASPPLAPKGAPSSESNAPASSSVTSDSADPPPERASTSSAPRAVSKSLTKSQKMASPKKPGLTHNPFPSLIGHILEAPIPSLIRTPIPTPIPREQLDRNRDNSLDIADTTGVPVVETFLLAGDPTQTGSQLTVAVRIRGNKTGIIPLACAFSIRFNPQALRFLGPETADLGQPFSSEDIEESPLVRLRRVTTFGNAANQNPNPTCFLVRFEVLENAPRPFPITISDDLQASVPLLALDFISSIIHQFDSSQTENLGASAPQSKTAPSHAGSPHTSFLHPSSKPSGKSFQPSF